MSTSTVIRTLGERIQRDGWASAARSASRKAGELAGRRLAWDEPSLPLAAEDIHDAGPVPAQPGRTVDRLRVGIVCFPPSAGSGGHTTLFRMVRALEERGHHCTLVFYDPLAGGVDRHEPVIRRAWPDLEADIASVDDGFGSYDAVVASSWETAHVVASRNRTAIGFYFIQDYEPFFFPHGYLYDLAESSYTLGLQNIALGGMVATEMRRQRDLEPDLLVPFGCDTATYRLLESPEPRHGIVYYAKRTVDRRGYLLAKETLERFHQLCPDQPIHIVGDRVRGWDIPVEQHGSVPPAALNQLYNRTIASLAMSFTNVSLVPGELLAAGNVPVLNDLPGPRLDLDSPDAVWVPGRPDALAAALAEVVRADAASIASRARRLALRPRPSWAAAQSMTADFIEDTVRRGTVPKPGEYHPPPEPARSSSDRAGLRTPERDIS
ncbi:glycosyltransferase family 1 protein [Citricoccus sp. K5]|uniref:glycosyltransferase family 1 protein n=1 Tax=Citricoccus sp. K5 TaxID=2653135 RepID=UPI0012F0C55C|nr:glycosyltransferase family 1 protein [Citricoccus sp. K5]VXB06252.1 conserved hypothetical protein [Citricoccus sp. K5]